MRHIMVQYTVRAGQAEENARLIRKVFDSLRRNTPHGMRYSAYRLEDGVTFVHVASVEDPANNPLRQLAEFEAFTSTVKERCEILPRTSVLEEVGSYLAAPTPHGEAFFA